MNRDDIEYILDSYGLNKILSDHNLTKIHVLESLEDVGLIYLEQYLEKETEDE